MGKPRLGALILLIAARFAIGILISVSWFRDHRYPAVLSRHDTGVIRQTWGTRSFKATKKGICFLGALEHIVLWDTLGKKRRGNELRPIAGHLKDGGSQWCNRLLGVFDLLVGCFVREGKRR